jgi:pilus assembly protein Flp/PilA
MNKLLARFSQDDSGATAIEYGLIAALVAVACIAIWRGVGTNLNGVFTRVNTDLAAAATAP